MKNKKPDSTLLFVWAYLLLNGLETIGRWDYYGGQWEAITPEHRWDYELRRARMTEIRNQAITVGIDWQKTTVPEVEDKSEFVSTFDGSRDVLATLGTLVLKDGRRFKIGSNEVQAAGLATVARDLMNGHGEVWDLMDRLGDGQG